MISSTRHTVGVLGAPIDVIDWTRALKTIESWAQNRESRYICICNAHSVVTASRDPQFMRVITDADMATPDGAPVAWMIRRRGYASQERINGPDLMLKYCAQAAQTGMPIFLLGSTEETLRTLTAELRRQFPGLKIAGRLSPPFRPLSAEEDADLVRQVNDSGAGVVFVSLGCPKQELWMAAHRTRIQGVMIGVGAAFDFHAGTIARAPTWMRRNGLEWLHRLASEPRRLWRRYLTTNFAFVAKAALELLRGK